MKDRIKNRTCAQCRSSERVSEGTDEPVYAFVWGRIWAGASERRMPYRAYLCREHLQMLLEEGAELRVIRFDVDELTRSHTAYRTFGELCRNRPTLRVVRGDGEERRLEVAFLADAYDAFQAAGGDARRAVRG